MIFRNFCRKKQSERNSMISLDEKVIPRKAPAVNHGRRKGIISYGQRYRLNCFPEMKSGGEESPPFVLEYFHPDEGF